MTPNRGNMSGSFDAKAKIVLLLSSLEQAQTFSIFLREMGAIPSIFRDLKTFWHAVIKERPSLAIIDASQMVDEHSGLDLSKHPLVLAQELALAFTYNHQQKGALVLTHQFFHFGLIDTDLEIPSQLKLILERVQKNLLTMKEVSELKQKLQKMNDVRMEAPLASWAIGLLEKVAAQFLEVQTPHRFADVLSETLSQLESVESFTALQTQGKDLVAPAFYGSKYRPAGNLKVGQSLEQGMEFFAQNMAIEVALEMLGGTCMPLSFYDSHRNPDLLVFLKLKAGEEKKFPWKVLEILLNSLYRRGRNTDVRVLGEIESNQKAPEFWSSWQMMGEMAKNDKNDQFWQLDFTPLITFIKDHAYTPFHWQAFYKDFMNLMMLDRQITYTYANTGIYHMVFKIDKKDEKNFADFMKAHLHNFHYASYFADPTLNRYTGLTPELWKLPPSFWEGLKILEH